MQIHCQVSSVYFYKWQIQIYNVFQSIVQSFMKPKTYHLLSNKHGLVYIEYHWMTWDLLVYIKHFTYPNTRLKRKWSFMKSARTNLQNLIKVCASISPITIQEIFDNVSFWVLQLMHTVPTHGFSCTIKTKLTICEESKSRIINNY